MSNQIYNIMRTFMSASVLGSKQDREKANSIANVIAGIVISLFLVVLLLVVL